MPRTPETALGWLYPRESERIAVRIMGEDDLVLATERKRGDEWLPDMDAGMVIPRHCVGPLLAILRRYPW